MGDTYPSIREAIQHQIESKELTVFTILEIETQVIAMPLVQDTLRNLKEISPDLRLMLLLTIPTMILEEIGR